MLCKKNEEFGQNRVQGISSSHTVCIAPMLNYTHRYYRYFMRLLTKHAFLYSEMVTTPALLKSKHAAKILSFSEIEHPLGIQLAGNCPKDLARCAKMAEDAGYDEINLNMGCPSPKIQAAKYGATLLLEPDQAAECVNAVRNAVKIPVSIKTRLGVSSEVGSVPLIHWIQKIAQAGCLIVIIHARFAQLATFSPKENRTKIPLSYEAVYQIKKQFPSLTIVLNGGITDQASMKQHLILTDGVMIGTQAYKNPYFFSNIDEVFYEDFHDILSREEVAMCYARYLKEQKAEALVPSAIGLKPLYGLYFGTPKARAWRKYLQAGDFFRKGGVYYDSQ